MADRITQEQRRRNMQCILGRNTRPEIYLRKLLFSHGYRYRTHSKNVPGHPDIWLKKYNTAIFVHGCFWHRHVECKYASMPKTREDFWKEKFRKNQERDEHIKKQLAVQKIKCLIVWECTLKVMRKNAVKRERIVATIEAFFNAEDIYLEL